MADKKPIRAVFNDAGTATGLAEFQSGDTLGLTHGGLGASLSIGSAGQVLKVNSGASALEFGSVEAIVNIDGATDLTSNTLVVGDQLLLSDGGTEGRVTLTQLDTLFSSTTKTLTNKTLTAPTLTGTAVMADLDISGDVDVDGTLEADAITVNGATLTETITDLVGGMVSSNTETGISVSFQDADNTLDFALGAAQTTITSILATDLKIGEDDQTKIDFETADTIHFYAGNQNQIKIVDGAIVPITDNDIDLGTSSLEFKDAYFDGTVTADAFAGPLTGDVTGNVSGTAATVTTAAQSNITSLGTLTTLTVDNVITNGATIGHTDDTDLMTLADGILTVAGEVSMTTLDIGGTNVTATAAELNFSDGVTSNVQTQMDTKTTKGFAIASAIVFG